MSDVMIAIKSAKKIRGFLHPTDLGCTDDCV
jgi:hypothetical protein